MELTDDDIYALVQEIWDSFLQLEVIPAVPGEAADASLSAFIHIHGSWEGSVVMHTSLALATRIAGVMFDMDPEELDSAEVHDALGEIVNMLGGSVKSLVEGEASLSLPTVIGGSQYTVAVPGSSEVNEVWFTSETEPILVRVLERASAEVRL